MWSLRDMVRSLVMQEGLGREVLHHKEPDEVGQVSGEKAILVRFTGGEDAG